MLCKYCHCTFKLSKWQQDNNTCLNCSGVLDDLSIEDEELDVELQIIANPSGKTKTFSKDEDYEF